jgi:hypothetical protein
MAKMKRKMECDHCMIRKKILREKNVATAKGRVHRFTRVRVQNIPVL